jgi:hypothetical protein
MGSVVSFTGVDHAYPSSEEFKNVWWGLVVRVPGYRSRDPGFDFRRYQIFCLQLVQRSRKCWPVYPLPHTSSWRNV